MRGWRGWGEKEKDHDPCVGRDGHRVGIQTDSSLTVAAIIIIIISIGVSINIVALVIVAINRVCVKRVRGEVDQAGELMKDEGYKCWGINRLWCGVV